MYIKTLCETLNAIPDCSVSQVSLFEENVSFIQIEDYNPSSEYSEHTLYVTSNPDDACVNTQTILSMLLLSDQEIESPGPINLIRAETLKPVSEVVSEISKALVEDAKMDAKRQVIFNALLSNHGLQFIMDVASRVFGHPCWIIDMNYNFVTKPDPDTIADPLLKHEIDLGHIVDESVKVLQELSLWDVATKTLQPAVYPAVSRSDITMLSVAIRIGGITVSYLNSICENDVFTSTELVFAQWLSSILSLELQKNPYFENSRGVRFSYFLSDLINNRFNSESTIRNRLSALGFRIYQYFGIVVVDINDNKSEYSGNKIEILASQFKVILGQCMYVVHNNTLVFLYTLRSSSPSDTREFFQRLKNFLKNCNLKGAASDIFNDILKVSDKYYETEATLVLGKSIDPDELLYIHSDYMFPSVIRNLKQSFSPEQFQNGALSKLKQSDAEQNTILLPSLKAYIEYGASIPRAASAMGIHVNTMRYRLSKIRELTCCNLESGQTLVELYLALRLEE